MGIIKQRVESKHSIHKSYEINLALNDSKRLILLIIVLIIS